MMLFYAELLAQKSTMPMGRRGGGGAGGTLNEVLNKYELNYLFIYSLKTLFETSTNRYDNCF